MENLNLSELGLVSTETINLLNKANLNWEVKAERLITVSGLETENIAIVRQDTRQILGVHKDSYVPVQNSEMYEMLQKLAGLTGHELHTGGEMKGGRLVYGQLKTNDLKLGQDIVKGYATAINSHDGTVSYGLGSSTTTISCMNTFHSAYKQVEFKIKHTKNMQSKIDLLAMQLESVVNQEKQTFETIKRLSEVEIDPKLKNLVLSRFLQLGKEERLSDLSTLSTRKQNIMAEIEANIFHQTSDKGQNLWGLFSGFTRYTTHSVKGSEIENKLAGIYGKREMEVFAVLAETVN
jgi:hypothetical protein